MGRKKEALDISSILKNLRCLQIGGELSNSPINILTQAKVLSFPPVLNPGLKGTLLLVGKNINPCLGQASWNPKGNRITCLKHSEDGTDRSSASLPEESM